MVSDVTASVEVLPGLDAAAPLLQVTDLRVEFRTRVGLAHAVNGVSFHLSPGETLAILGESGCGKSVTAQAVMGIIDSPPGFVTGGEIRYRGVDLLTLPEEQRRAVRANRIAIIFQDALSALNPVFTVGFQISELFRKHRGMSREDSRRRAVEMLDLVQIPAARQRVRDFPHQFSGGMRQRVMIAIALALDPDVLIADEPTTALDVTVQAQIMKLLAQLQREREMGLILITHDMGVVAETARRVVVQYAGQQAEMQDVLGLFADPQHPYTAALLHALPERAHERLLPTIPGLVPGAGDRPSGCLFHPRCEFATDRCAAEEPPFAPGPRGRVRCHYPLTGEIPAGHPRYEQ